MAVPIHVTPSAQEPGVIDAVRFVQRRAKDDTPCGGWDQPLSRAIQEYYNVASSDRWSKRVLEFTRASPKDRRPVFIDATEWGELLALGSAPYLQGMSEQFDGDSSGSGNDECGQSFSVTLTATMHATPQHEAGPFATMPDPTYKGISPTFIWSRRRLLSLNSTGAISTGDVTLFVCQDWRWSYLFKSRMAAEGDAHAGAWVGGLNLTVLSMAEKEALGWYAWLKNSADYGARLTLRDSALNTSQSPMGTCTGLSKMPYVRGSRRSVGIDDYVMNVSEIHWNQQMLLPNNPVGTPFHDRVAIASFFLDVHEMHNYQPNNRSCYTSDLPPHYIPYYNDDHVLPFSIPLRAFTNKKFNNNFLLAGKTIATSFLVSSAVRLHPGEWATGSASGAVAATLVKTETSIAAVLKDPLALAHVIETAEKHTPRDWKLKCPWGVTAPAQGNGWSCVGGVTPKPPPTPPPVPSTGGFECLGPKGNQRCVQVRSGSSVHNSTCGGKCKPLAAVEWLASIPDNWAVKPNSHLASVVARNCTGWSSTRHYVLHANDTGAISLPSNVSFADAIAKCMRACCSASNCFAWVTGPADSNGPHWKVGDPRCFLKSEAAVRSQRWPMLNNSLAAYGIAPASPPPPQPAGHGAVLTALRATELKKSELFSGNLPPALKKSVKKGAVWSGVEQIDEQYWLVRPLHDATTQQDENYGLVRTSTPCRDRTLWPFSSNSIWNQPIGSGAVFEPAWLFQAPRGAVSQGRCDIPRAQPELRSSCPGTTGGVTQAQCEARGCCYATFPSPDPHGYPWCFNRWHSHGPANFHNDPDYFVVTSASDPLVDWVDQGWWGSAASHNITNCTANCHCSRLPSARVATRVRVPENWTTDQRHLANGGAAFLLPDHTTVLQMQPTYRCTAGSPLLSESNVFCHGGNTDPNHDIHPSSNTSDLPGCETKDLFPRCTSILGDGAQGAHGGSGLSALGGVIRQHELVSNSPNTTARIPHAMKIELFGHRYYFRGAGLPGGRSLQPHTPENGGRTQYVWPATSSDNYANYGRSPIGYNGSLPYLAPGALLAIPRSHAKRVNTSTIPGKIIKRALIEYPPK
jgi:hypothetical protein